VTWQFLCTWTQRIFLWITAGTQTLPHRALTGVALTMAPTTELSSGTNSRPWVCSLEHDVREAFVIAFVDLGCRLNGASSRLGTHGYDTSEKCAR